MKDEIIELIDNWKDKHGKTDEDIERLIDSLDEDEIFKPYSEDAIFSEIRDGDCILWKILKFYEKRNIEDYQLHPHRLICYYYCDGHEDDYFRDRVFIRTQWGEISKEDQISVFGEEVGSEEVDINLGWLDEMILYDYEYTTEEYKELCEEVLIPFMRKCVDMYIKAYDDFDYILDKLIEMKKEYDNSDEPLRRLALGVKDLFEGLYIDDFTINADGDLDFYNNQEFYRNILNAREKEKEHER